jgi:Asp-tRNA(Asn)/Glu-tRNA(Gln) amidotransferase A subunit family amidase
MARSASDAALLLSQMVGNRLYLERPGRGAKPLAGVRVGVPTGSFGGVAVDAGIAARVAAFGRELASLGATLVSFPAPRSRADNLSGAEGFRFFLTGPGKEIDSYHRQWFPQRAAEYTNDVALTLTLIRAANTVPSDASNVRTIVDELARDWRDAFANARIHLVLQPAAVIPAPLRLFAAARTQSIGDAMVVWDYVGWPVICLPAGQDSDALPVGVQLVGLPETEPALCRTAITAQAHFPHHEERPPGV